MKTQKKNSKTKDRKYPEGISVTEILKFTRVYFSTAFKPNLNWGEKVTKDFISMIQKDNSHSQWLYHSETSNH